VDLNKLSTADKVIALSGILFLIALFLPWYGVEGYDETGTDYFLTGILPFLIILVMVGQIALTKFSDTELPNPPLPWSQIHAIAGAVVVVLLVLRTAVVASAGPSEFEIDLDRKFGLFFALLAAIGVAVGGYLKYQEGDEVTAGGAGSAPPTPF
jgi:uncharacterized membrane protein YidH (DUF202 family)